MSILKLNDYLVENKLYKKLSEDQAIEIIKKNCKVWMENYKSLPVLVRTVSDFTEYSQPDIGDELRYSKTDIPGIPVAIDNLESWKKDKMPKRTKAICTTSVKDYDAASDAIWDIGVVVIPFDGTTIAECEGDDFNYHSSWKNLAAIIGNHTMILQTLFEDLSSFVQHFVLPFDTNPQGLQNLIKVVFTRNPKPSDVGSLFEICTHVLSNKENLKKAKELSVKYDEPIFDNFFNQNKTFEKWLDNLLSPKNNNFHVWKYTKGFSVKKNKEVFFEGGCIMISAKPDANDEDDTYRNLIKKLGI